MDLNILKFAEIPVDPEAPYKMGRHIRHDSRSLQFGYQSDKEIKSISHDMFYTRLDQGDLGSCTGNAFVGARGTKPHVPPTDFQLNEDLAVKVYSIGTTYDSDPDNYPPTDTGSDGLSVCKAGVQLGLISGYQHAFSLEDALTALQDYPFITGINWYNNMFNPDESGLVTISRRDFVAGGHEVMCYGVDVENQLVWFANSWGTSWGVDGRFCMSYDTYGRLLSEQGDVTIPLPAEVPAPTPVPPTPKPTPGPSPDSDVATELFAQQAETWLGRNPYYYKPFQVKIRTWLAAYRG